MKYRFEVIYQNKCIKEASRLMKTLDFDIGDVGIKQSFTFTSQKDTPICEIKQHIKKAFEYSELEIINIEGGKIE